jgi:hypothetical protein
MGKDNREHRISSTTDSKDLVRSIMEVPRKCGKIVNGTWVLGFCNSFNFEKDDLQATASIQGFLPLFRNATTIQRNQGLY